MNDMIENIKFMIRVAGFWGIYAIVAMVCTVIAAGCVIEGVKIKNNK